MRTPFFFLPFLVFIFLVLFFGLLFLFALIQVGAITVAFTKMGLSTQQVFWVLLGTLLGADILHLANTRTLNRLRSPMLSIGGAGTFDGIFLTGILAVLLA
jgi:uncharacterized membrane protein